MSDTPQKEFNTNIRLDAQDRTLLERLAKHERMTRSEIVRRAIRAMGAERGLYQGTEIRQAASA